MNRYGCGQHANVDTHTDAKADGDWDTYNGTEVDADTITDKARTQLQRRAQKGMRIGIRPCIV